AIDRFRELFVAAAARALPEGSGEIRSVAEVYLNESDRVLDVVDDLSWLEPCGVSNEHPVIGVRDARVVRSQEVRGGHLQVQLSLGSGTLLFGFGSRMGSMARQLRAGMRVQAAGTLRRDGYRGGDAVGLWLSTLDIGV
ncbi:MAG: hypothetical protein FWD57_00985, partial [Polyangiaceae bacterium]|nr:hypothetical protein [Polyangiaceae bacterium]